MKLNAFVLLLTFAVGVVSAYNDDIADSVQSALRAVDDADVEIIEGIELNNEHATFLETFAMGNDPVGVKCNGPKTCFCRADRARKSDQGLEIRAGTTKCLKITNMQSFACSTDARCLRDHRFCGARVDCRGNRDHYEISGRDVRCRRTACGH